MSFQTAMQVDPALGVEGQQATDAPVAIFSRLAVTAGVTVGRFVWPYSTDPAQVQNSGSGTPFGFAARDETGVITTYLAESAMLVPGGFPVQIAMQGEFFAKTLTVTTYGQKVFASTTTGEVKTGAAGATISGYVETPWKVKSGVAAAIGDLIEISTWVNT
jgi:hypothetical protein